MTRTGAAPLDDLDRDLIAALRRNGREPAASLARTLGVSRATINSRLERLVATGTVIGFSVRTRDDAVPETVRAMALIEIAGRSTDTVIGALRGFPEIRALHTTNGSWDLVAEISTDSLASFDRLLGAIRSIDGVVNSETSVLLNAVLR